MIILGLNIYHPDSSACLIKNNKITFAIEEERLNRLKHFSGLPFYAINECLKNANITLDDVSYIAINSNPKSNLIQKLKFIITNFNYSFIKDKFNQKKTKSFFVNELEDRYSIKNLNSKIINVDHHVSHMMSCILPSEFDNSVNLSIDAFGDFVSTSWGLRKRKYLSVDKKIYFPHSLGIFYEAFTQYLGFTNYGDEYKLMGLSAYGKPTEVDKIKKVIKINKDGTFLLNLKYFNHHLNNVSLNWENNVPKTKTLFSNSVEKIFDKISATTDDYQNEMIKNYAASVQYVYEEIFFNLLSNLYKKYKIENLSLSGGCAQNSVANGKITNYSNFKNIFIPPNPGDGGGALGAALFVHNKKCKEKIMFQSKVYLGSDYSNENISNCITSNKITFKDKNINISFNENFKDIINETVTLLVKKKVIGWFQGKSEWGPRALGNRSILCDPRGHQVKDLINQKIKKREIFRPFAPSILYEHANNWFEIEKIYEPYMSRVVKIKKAKEKIIPAVVHIDGTGRLQTVTKKDNLKFYQLIDKFNQITQVPLLLNTSFNENEPIVNSPEEAIKCFLRTDMDVLVMENYILSKP